MKHLSAFLALFVGVATASAPVFQELPRFLAQNTTVPASALSKGSASAVVSQSQYSSANYNVSFTCPAGWTITAIDSVANRVLLNVSKTGRNSVLIYVTKHATADEAVYWDAYSTWLGVRTAYGASTTAPYVMVATDTLAAPYHLSYVQLEYDVQAGTRVYDLVAASKGVFSQFVAYSATAADYDANSADYDAIWDGMNFYDDVVPIQGAGGGVLPKGGTGVSLHGNILLNPHGLTLDLRDANGRRRITSSQKRIELDKAQKLFLKVHEK